MTLRDLPVRGRIVSAVFRAEMTSVLRDRRTLITGLLVPILLYPLGGAGMVQLTTKSVSSVEAIASRVCLAGAPDDVAAVSRVLASDSVRIESGCSAGALPDRGQDAVLDLPAGAAAALAGDSGFRATVRYSTQQMRGPLAVERLRDAFARASAARIEARLKEHALPAQFANPITLDEKDVAPPAKTGMFRWAPAIIFCLMFFSVLGVFLPAIDVTAGDRERNTLETLLSAPSTAAELIAGKFLVVFTFGMLTTLLNVGSLFATMLLVVRGQAPGAVPIPFSAPVAIAVVLASMPTVALAAAFCMAIGCLAKNFRDAQNFLTPAYLALIFPAYAAALPTWHLTPFTAAIPVLNLPLTLRAIFEGTIEPRLLALGVVVNLAFCTVALLAGARLYSHEAIAFADAEPMDLLRRPTSASLRFTAGEGLSLFALAAALSFYVGLPLTQSKGNAGTFLKQSLFILLPPLAYAVWRRLEWRTAFALKRPGARAAGAALLAGVCAWVPIQLFVRYVQQPLFPVPPTVASSLRDLVGVGASWPAFVALGAAMPAIAEQLLFFGAVMQSLRPSMGRGAAVFTALLFALFHLNAWSLVPTFVIGLIAASLVLRSGSLWSGVLFHFTSNLCAILSATFARHGPAEEMGGPPLWAIVPALIGFALAVRLLRAPAPRMASRTEAVPSPR